MMMMPESKTMIQVSNLAPEANEIVLNSIFSRFGEIKGLSVIRNPMGVAENYAFVDYADSNAANLALVSMNKIKFYDRELNVSYANYGGAQPQTQMTVNQQSNAMTTRGHHIYVGDLSDNMDDKMMRDHFAKFGAILDAKIVRNNDGSSRGYGFIAFEREEDATEAIRQMDRSWLINKAIRVNWATRKTDQAPDYARTGIGLEKKNFDEVFKETSLSNTTVYCGGLLGGVTEDLIRAHFLEFGRIIDIKIYTDKAFAFVRFENHESAATAICAMHGKKINGYHSKCSWGKDQTAMAVASQIAAAQYNITRGPTQQQQQQPIPNNHAAAYYGTPGMAYGNTPQGFSVAPSNQQYYGARQHFGGGFGTKR